MGSSPISSFIRIGSVLRPETGSSIACLSTLLMLSGIRQGYCGGAIGGFTVSGEGKQVWFVELHVG
jgi:hypothetical protein